MEKMDVDDDTVVDLSVKRDRDLLAPPPVRVDVPQDLSRVSQTQEEIGLAEIRGLIPRSIKEFDDRYPRRNLRPRTERNYAESPDIIVLSDEEPRLNGFTNGTYESDSDEGEMPPMIPIKELSPAELEERERGLRKLREELRNEEMKLVLLKKLRQSQQMKENIAVVPPSQQQGTVTKPPVTGKLPPPPQQQPPPPLVRANHNKQPNVPMLRGVGSLPSSRPQNLHNPPPLMMGPRNSSTGMPMMMPQRGSGSLSSRTPVTTPPNVVLGYSGDRTAKEPQHSPAPLSSQQPDRVRVDDSQTPAQRQAAAKLALRKQLEKTLLQIPPPKPPPPEMHFIPNPSNTEFIYLLGLEHVVDFITKDHKTPPPPDAFKCSQCLTDFTPVWKWEKNPSKGKEPKVICEQCVTTNVKKALKAEHTNRLKTAFVKALQQEQEIEQRLAQVGGGAGVASPEPTTPAPSAPTPTASSTPKPATPTPPPPPPPTPPTPASVREHPLAKLAAESAAAGKFGSPHHMAAALQQQLLRGINPHQPLPAHVLSAFNPMLYPYQLALATGAKGPVAAAAANLAELQRQAADLQRQYLLDMIPPPAPSPSRSHLNNWKT